MMRPQVTAAFVVAALVLVGCSGAPKPTDPLPTDGLAPTRAALAAVECLVEVLRPVVPDSAQAREAWTGLGAAVETGRELCDSWEDAGEAPSTWRDWVSRTLGLVERLTVILVEAGVPVPSYVGIAVGACKLLLPILAAVVGV